MPVSALLQSPSLERAAEATRSPCLASGQPGARAVLNPQTCPMPAEEILSIRIATSDDAPGILDCLRSAFAPHQSQYTPGAFAATVLTPATLAVRMSGMRILVAVDGLEGVVGTIAFTIERTGTGHIRGMAVRAPWQGREVADRLLGDAEYQLRSSGCARVSLDTTAPLQQAIRFYEKHGFVATGRRRDFYGMDLFEYAKDLSPIHSVSTHAKPGSATKLSKI